MKIVIPGELPDLNTEINNAKKHWAIYAKHKDFWTGYIARIVAGQKLPQIKSPIAPRLVWFVKDNRKDVDNIIFAKKYIFDGFKLAGLIPDDSRKWIIGISGESVMTDKENPRVEIEIA